MDAICLSSVLTEDLPATLWLLSTPIQVIVALAMPLKKVPEMVGNSVSYLFSSLLYSSNIASYVDRQ